MKKLLFLILCTAAGSVSAQPWPRQERFTLDNTKRMTDASVSLFNVHSDYDFPYVIPAREDVTEKLVRILDYLEGATADGIADAGNDEWLQNLLAGWSGRDANALVSLILAESRGRKGLEDDCAVLVLHLSSGEKKPV